MLGRQVRLGVGLVLVAVLYQSYCPQVGVVLSVARSWEGLIEWPAAAVPSRVAVGVNANLDLVVSAVDLLRTLNVTAGAVGDSPLLTTLSELGALVGSSMQHCAGVERVLTDQAVFQQTVEAALTLRHSFHVGGNAALIARRVHELLQPSAEVMLVGPVGPRLRAALPSSIATPSHSTQTHDEMHVILEYASGDVWGSVTAGCANRVIYSHDEANSKMLSLEAFRASVPSFSPELVILSGAHLLEGQPKSFWQQRLADTATVLEVLPGSVPVHWELATVGDMEFFRAMADTLFPRIDSLGLNEQELCSAATTHGLACEPSSPPSVQWVGELLQWLLGHYAGSRLSRVHFHSLTFHVVATAAGGPWGNSASAVAAGAKVAGLQACARDEFTAEDFELRLPPTLQLEPDLTQSLAPVVAWQKGSVHFQLAPVLVCKRPLKTVGLGDAISASGLLHSTFS